MEYVMFDIESYPNYFCVGLRYPNGKKQILTNPYFVSKAFEKPDTVFVGWNNSDYDNYMIMYFIKHNASVAEMKEISDAIINGISKSHRYKSKMELAFDLLPSNERPGLKRPWVREFPFKTFDLLKWGKNQFQSLKEVEIILGMPQKKTPFPFNEPLPNKEAIKKVHEYLESDLDATYGAFKIYDEAGIVETRTSFLPLLPDAGYLKTASLSEKMFLKYYEHFIQPLAYDGKRSPEIGVRSVNVRDIPMIGGYIFEQYLYRDTYTDLISRGVINIDTQNKPELNADYTFADRKGNSIGLGVGGLHTKEISGIFKATPERPIINVDATSFWPSIISTLKLGTKLFPQYWRIMRSWLAERVIAKESGDKLTAKKLKDMINFLNGKLGEKFSKLYSQEMSCGLKIHGQLMLLQLWDMILLVDPTAEMINANTDGIAFQTGNELAVEEVFQQWSDIFKIGLEWERFSVIGQSSVNDYFAITEDGKLKTKGGSFNIDIDLDIKFAKSIASKKLAIEVIKGVKRLTPLARLYKEMPLRDFVVTFTATGRSKYKIMPFEETGTVALVAVIDGGEEVYKERFNEKKGVVEKTRFGYPYKFMRYHPDIARSNIDIRYYVEQAKIIIKGVKK